MARVADAARTMTWVAPAAAAPPTGPDEAPASRLDLGDRYTDLGLIARGGMGEVRRVRDRLLDCTVALKLLAKELTEHAPARARFLNEGTITAQLQHPGIVAVRDRGERSDGQLWYTMPLVRGQTYGELLHSDRDQRPDRVTLRRRVAVLARACEAMAYAHGQGVVHRDLKPENLMVGAFGEVLVMDWGIAARVEGLRPADSAIIGTPAFMAPEQARGDRGAPRPASDVYSLGAILHLVLTGRRPIEGPMDAVLATHAEHGIAPFAQGLDPHLPEALVTACRQTLTDDPSVRMAAAGPLADALNRWLAGAEQRSRARSTLAEAMDRLPRIAALRSEVKARRARAAECLSALPPFAPVKDKEPAWEEQDLAAACAREATVLETDWLQQVGAALEQSPALEEAHAALAEHYADRLRDAEALRHPEDIARFEAHLRQHDRGRYASLISGTGALTLVTDPPGAQVRAFRVQPERRRLVEVFEAVLGYTPLYEVPLARGSWVLELALPDRPVVRYPVFLGRGEVWDGVRPGGSEPCPVPLPEAGALGPDDLLVPAGRFWSGGDPDAVESLPRRLLWCDGIVVRRFVITNEEFLSARAHGAQLRAARPTGPGWDGQGGPWTGSQSDLRLPVAGLTLEECIELARWTAAHTGQPWRLPNELEFEKYARGVDARPFAWGDHLEPAWANVLGSHPQRSAPVAVEDFPSDISCYGVRGTVGNVRERCINPWLAEGPEVSDGVLTPGGAAPGPGVLGAVRGGGYTSTRHLSRAASRFAATPADVWGHLGLRLVRSLAADPPY